MAKNKIVILGAGLTGLSAAWHLERRGIDCRIFEKEAEAGGLCRSKNIRGFTFDYDGHLLHFKHRDTFNFIKNLLGANLIQHKRNAGIYYRGRYIRYPFQANLYGLPREVIQECLLGFIRAANNNHHKSKENLNFLAWINQTFGKGIARHFMVPYNKKFWTVTPRRLTCEWLDGFIPVPSLGQIIEGTIGESKRQFGYNAWFWYPKEGGIQEISRAIQSGITGLRTLFEATGLNIRKKEIQFKNNFKQEFDSLILTTPLPEILNLTRNLPSEVANCLNRLKYTSIFNLNLSVDRENLSGKHWIYFPESKFVFFRVGFPGNFSFKSAPKKTSSLYVEVAYTPGTPVNKNTMADRITEDLIKARILRASDKILARDYNDIKYGYIIYDRKRQESLGLIKDFLHKNNIHCLGRYGSWSYMSMEDCLLEGKKIAGIF